MTFMADDKRMPPSLLILLMDAKDTVLADGKVVVRFGPRGGREIEVPFNKDLGLYVAREVPRGPAMIFVAHSGMEEQTRETTIGDGENREVFILGEQGGQNFFRGKVRVPVTADPDLIGVSISREYRRKPDELERLAESLGLQRQEVPKAAERMGQRLFRASGVDPAGAMVELREHPAVEHIGRVVQTREDGFSFLSGEAVVQFDGPRIEEVRKIAREHGFSLKRGLVFADGAFVLVWRGNPAELLDAIEKLASREDVEWAEPNMIVTPVLDAITPGDVLWNGCWDRQLIGSSDAWQTLQDNGLDTFGDPDIVLAVFDSGTESSGGVPTNPDFQGNVSNGQPKLLASFDFNNMVANNDNPWDDHGSGVAGVCAAMANNPIPFNAQGVVGSAPNVQIITVASGGGTEVDTADAYIWMAGFDPQSPTAGFPASPPPRGADVITCSLGLGSGAPLSGTAQALLDFVTTFGRDGKGTMCFFSTGNNNLNNVTSRPYGAYEKCFAIAGTTLANDGVTEIRASFSGWGQIDFCAPTHDQYPPLHNPPTGYATWSAAHQGDGNLPTNITATTTLSSAASAGDTSITMASTAGFAVNAVIHVGPLGANGSEPARITAVNAATNTLTIQGYSSGWTGGLLNAHASGTVVVTGPANHKNVFGGTSSATPLTAGVAALVLSADPSLTYIEAREIMRDTAEKLDTGNTTTNGQWLDINGDPSVTSGLDPVRSGWYGFGRIDAAAAVQGVIDNMASRDMVIRDNIADTGAVATTGAFWNSPDIWCRTSDPASDPGAFPASYGAAGPHQAPIRGQQNWVCLRVRNNGTDASLDAWVRVSIAHFPGMEFTYPASWQPTNGPGDPLPSPMTPGTYFIGEAKVSGLAPGADTTVVVPWPAGLIPPATVSTPGGDVSWHPCLLAEITPHDGPNPTGNHVWDDNNLAQKNISIVDADSTPGTDFRAATVIGNLDNEAECLLLEINRGKLPRQVTLYVDLMDPRLTKRLLSGAYDDHLGDRRPPLKRGLEPETRLSIDRDGDFATVVRREFSDLVARLNLTFPVTRREPRQPWKRGVHEGREVILLEPLHRVRLPICAGAGRLSPVVIGGVYRDDVPPGEYEIILIQRQPDGSVSGSASVMLRVGKRIG
jgi:subtilisin family serine protease